MDQTSDGDLAARYRRLLGRVGALCFELTADGTAVYVNDACAALTGYHPDELLGRDLLALLCPAPLAAGASELWQRLREGDVAGHELAAVTRQGRPLALDVTTANVYGPAGELVAVVGVAADVAPGRRAEEAARQLAAIVEGSDDAIVGETLDGIIATWNAGAERVYGYAAAEVVGRSGFVLVPPERADELPPILRRLRRGERVEHVETVRVRKDGRRIHVSLTASPIRDAAGRLTGTSTIARDVTDRKRAEERIHFQASLLDQVRNAVVVTDLNGIIIYWNRFAETLYQWRAAEVLGQHLWETIVPPEGRAAAELIAAPIRDTGYGEGELVVRRKDGKVFPALVIDVPLKDAQGKVSGVIAVSLDVTEQKRLEEQYRQAQKMEAVGRLAGGVAHDFNNLLTIISGYSDLVLDALPAGDPCRELVGEIRKSGARATALTRQLLAFSRQQKVTPVVLDLNALIADMGKMLRRLVNEDVSLTTALAPDLGKIKADPGQVDQVVMNLVLNARDALPQGGAITVASRNVELSEADLSAHPGGRPGSYVLLSVADTGCGIDETTQAHIFEPFFTTKEVGKGTGLGLATVYGIVQQAGGFIEVDSQPGRGATFKVYFPRVASGEWRVATGE
jgi:PAS domain S-box-containing protein